MTDRPRQTHSDRHPRPVADNRPDTPDAHHGRATPARRSDTRAAPAGDTGQRRPAPGKATAAVTQELRQVVNDIDEHYRKSHSVSERDPVDPLGGPGNFGGGKLDEKGRDPQQ